MDLEANKQEQLKVATEVMRIWDLCPESGEFEEWHERDLVRYAYDLAELVIAAADSKIHPARTAKQD